MSSLQPIEGPAQLPLSTESTVSNVVAAPQVWIVAVPDLAGVHWKTCSGAVLVAATQPLNALAPVVVPVKVPPAAGRTVGSAHVPPGSVVLVVDVGGGAVEEVVGPGDVELVVEVLDEVVVGTSDVLVDVGDGIVVEELVDEVVVGASDVLVELLVENAVVVLVVVEVAPGGITVRLNAPLAPPHEPL